MSRFLDDGRYAERAKHRRATATHYGVHWCSLDPYDCLGMQYREKRPRLIAALRSNISYHQQMIRRERKRLAAAYSEDGAG